MQTEVNLDSDILQPIPLEEWPLLQERLKRYWPNNANCYYWIQNSIKWKKQEPDLALQIYCPGGEYKDKLTFVGISSLSWITVVVFTEDPSGQRLYEGIVKSNRFDWNKTITFCGVHKEFQPILYSAISTLQTNLEIEIIQDLPGRFCIKSAADCANVELEVPDDCYLGELTVSHLPLINSVWPHADKENPENSIKFLRPSVTLNKSIGLFLKDGDILVSWALHSEWHGLGSVQTLEPYRRKGYAKIVINALAKQLGEKGISPILSIVCGNVPSERMFDSLGWKMFNLVTWIGIKKISKKD